jgi:uncharacterized protein YdeI (YjbR/CyaY-like superfamily)
MLRPGKQPLAAHLKSDSLKFFASPAHFRRWLERNHQRKAELLVGYYKKSTGRPSVTWAESVDEALCFGWIDGIRRAVDEESYAIRFTPRRKTSVWSAVNICNVQRLIEAGRMQALGLAAFAARQEHRSEIYSYEERPRELPQSLAKIFRKNKIAWKFFWDQPPGYRRRMIWWVISARTALTRQKRLAQLIKVSGTEKRIR